MLKALFNIFRAPTEESSDQAPETPKKADNVADQALQGWDRAVPWLRSELDGRDLSET